MFNSEKFDTDCESLVRQMHDLAEGLNIVATHAREAIGGRLVAKELDKAAMTLFEMESLFRHDIFEIGDN